METKNDNLIYHIEMRRTKRIWFKKLMRFGRRQYYSRIVVNGEVVWTGEPVKNYNDMKDTAYNLHINMLPGKSMVEDFTK